MNIWRRIILSIKRHPFQEMMKFILIFVLGNVLFASIAIEQSSKNVHKELLRRSPTNITIELTNSVGLPYVYDNLRKISEELEDSEYVKKIKSFYMLEVFIPQKNPGGGTIFDSMKLGGVIDVKNYEYEFIEGRMLTQEEVDANERKIVIIGDYGYRVGDMIQIPLPDYKIEKVKLSETMEVEELGHEFNPKTVEYEIVGITKDYEFKNAEDYLEKANTLPEYLVAYSQLDELIEKQNEILDTHSEWEKEFIQQEYEAETMNRFVYLKRKLVKVDIQTTGVESAEIVSKQLIENPVLPSGYYAVNTSSQDYRYVQAPLENLVALSMVAFIASVLLIVVLLSLISILFLRTRTSEIGILMAMGEKKRNIFIQFIMEMLVVGMLACSISMISGNYLGNVISQEFVRIQVDVDSEQEYQQENPDELSQIDLLEIYEVELDFQYVCIILVSSFIILVISSALPLGYVLRIKPKNVLM